MNSELRQILERDFPSIQGEVLARVLRFYDLLVAENAVQNLTRLISPQDFAEGHLVDVLELRKSEFLRFPAMDLGSGGGVPGLLAACFSAEPWLLVDSEKKKADFLSRAAAELGLSHVRAFGERAEDVLKRERVQAVVARAVGTLTKIYTWIRPCSTWNNLVLLKGPAWEEEWTEFSRGKWKSELKILRQAEYVVGAEEKRRRLVLLQRVPRGT